MIDANVLVLIKTEPSAAMIQTSQLLQNILSSVYRSKYITSLLLTIYDLVTHICVMNLDHHKFR